MRIMLYGTSPLVGSGYASAVRYVSKGLQARGHDVGIFAWNSHAGQILGWDGIPIYPRANTLNGSDGLGPFATHFGADVVIGVCDPWVMNQNQWRAGHNAKVVHWYPCQSEPASKILVNVVNSADARWCYSRWGNEVMRRDGSPESRYVPLGVATEVYRPLDRAECRARIISDGGVNDRFLAVMVAANSSTIPTSRKAFDQVMQGWKLFLDHEPDALLYLHTWPGPEQGGFNLHAMAEAFGVAPSVRFPDSAEYLLGFADSTLAKIYNAADVAVQTTTGEGFGLPIVEAQACGTPVLTTDCSSMPELTAHGIVVPGCAKMYAPAPMEGLVTLPDPAAICKALCAVRFGGLETTPEDGLRLAASLSWDRVLDEYLLPALAEVVPVETLAA